MNFGPILQVEDDENDVLFLRLAFKNLKLPNPLFVVRDGQQAIDYLSGAGKYADRAQFPIPALMLLDLKMPRKTGMDVLRWVRAHPAVRHLIVVIFSASGTQCDVDRAFREGANAFLVKPAGVDKLTETVRALHEFWFEQNQFPGTGERIA